MAVALSEATSSQKGIGILLHAWQQIEPRFPNWQLHIVGIDDPSVACQRAQIKKLAHRLGVRRISIRGPSFGSGKAQELQQASLFVLAPHSENFGVAVAEALAHGVSEIFTEDAPVAGLKSHAYGWWIEQGVDSLEACLHSALARPSEHLRVMGHRVRQWIEQDFTWACVGRTMLEMYRWLIDGGIPPAWVRVT